MPFFQLKEELIFPDPELAMEDGLLAMGGDLSPERILLAYKMGIFPWFNEGDPILWWSPDPRMILRPENFHVSRSLKRLLNKHVYEVRFDSCFGKVIDYCSNVEREGQNGSWITSQMKTAYCKLHEMGYANSIEVFSDDKLVGGMYGISIGKAFFGESMFSLEPNASKIALKFLCDDLKQRKFRWVDCQIVSEHLEKLGAIPIPRKTFLKELRSAIADQ